MSGLLAEGVSGCGILGTGTAFPSGHGGGRWVQNDEVHALVHGPDWRERMAGAGKDPEYVERTLGFRRRFWTHTPGAPTDHRECNTDDLVEAAASAALADAACDAGEIDLCIVASTTPARIASSMAAYVGARIGLTCAAWEIKAGCSSAVHALGIAYRFLQAGARRALVVSAETLSKYVDAGPLAYAAADAGAAVVIGTVSEQGRGLLGSYHDADGAHASLAGVPGPLPPARGTIESGAYLMQLSGDMETVTSTKWAEAPKALFAATGLTPADVVAYVPNQPNRRAVRAGAAACGVEESAVVDKVSEYANCGSASALVALHDARVEGRVHPGDLVLVNAVGGGLAWGGLLLRS